MANWNLPTVNSNYLDFVAEINGKFNDAAAMAYVGATNLPSGTFRYNRGGFFEEWDLSNWLLRILTVNGGGTGANSAAGARANLGIGSMGTQNSNAVNITGGSIVGVSYSANDITTGVMALARGGTGQSLAISPYGTTFVSDGTRLVLISGTYIAELDGSHIVQGTIPLARLGPVATGPGPNGFDGINVFYAELANSAPIELRATTITGINYTANGGTPGKKRMRQRFYQDTYSIERLDDGYSYSVTVLDITWDGYVTCFGGFIHNINGANIATGVINPARLGTGPANSTTFLRGDGTWQVVSTSGGASIPSGLIAMFNTNCPAGWTRFVQLDGRFPTGSNSAGGTGGAASHSHSIGLNSSPGGRHDHGFSVSGTANGRANGSASGNAAGNISGTTGNNSGGGLNANTISQDFYARNPHTHDITIAVNLPVTVNIDLPVSSPFSASGRTDEVADHTHQLNGRTADEQTYPPYYTLVFCQKD